MIQAELATGNSCKDLAANFFGLGIIEIGSLAEEENSPRQLSLMLTEGAPQEIGKRIIWIDLERLGEEVLGGVGLVIDEQQLGFAAQHLGIAGIFGDQLIHLLQSGFVLSFFVQAEMVSTVDRSRGNTI